MISSFEVFLSALLCIETKSGITTLLAVKVRQFSSVIFNFQLDRDRMLFDGFVRLQNIQRLIQDSSY